MTRKTSSRTRFASIFLALALVMNLVPLSAFATKDENGTVDANAELTSVNGQVSGENASNADKANGEVGDENAANAANAASGADANGESVSEPVASYTVRITLPEEGIALRGGQSDELLTQTVRPEVRLRIFSLSPPMRTSPLTKATRTLSMRNCSMARA